MSWKETGHSTVAAHNRDKIKKEASAMSVVEAFSVDTAAEYAAKMLRIRSKGWGDEGRALEDISKRCGMTPRSLKRLIRRETKEIGVSAFGKIRIAYLNFCKSMIASLEHDIAIASGRHGDAAFQDILSKVEILSEEVRAEIERAKG